MQIYIFRVNVIFFFFFPSPRISPDSPGGPVVAISRLPIHPAAKQIAFTSRVKSSRESSSDGEYRKNDIHPVIQSV